ncbi:hypothetical protein CR513_33190, partial [Mucuna pruriens]
MLLLQEFDVEIRDKKANACGAMVCRYLHFLVASTYPQGSSRADKEILESDEKYCIWDDPYLWRLCNDQVYSRVRDLISPLFLSFYIRRRPLRIELDSLEGLRLWAILAHHFPRRTCICLDL